MRAIVERMFGRPIGEVSEVSLEYVAGSHRWPAEVRASTSPTDIGELRENFQIVSWELAPGDLAVSHGDTLRLRQSVGVGVDDGLSPVAGPDLGEDVVHVAFHRRG